MAALSVLMVLFGISLALLAIVAAPIILAVVAIVLVLKLVLFLLFLPFRLVKLAIGIGVAGLVGGLCLAAVPLLPIALAAVVLYFLLRRPRPAHS